MLQMNEYRMRYLEMHILYCFSRKASEGYQTAYFHQPGDIPSAINARTLTRSNILGCDPNNYWIPVLSFW